jgi:hypothetical protein
VEGLSVANTGVCCSASASISWQPPVCSVWPVELARLFVLVSENVYVN